MFSRICQVSGAGTPGHEGSVQQMQLWLKSNRAKKGETHANGNKLAKQNAETIRFNQEPANTATGSGEDSRPDYSGGSNPDLITGRGTRFEEWE